MAMTVFVVSGLALVPVMVVFLKPSRGSVLD